MKIRKALAIMIICLAGINLTGYKFFISEDLNPIMEDYLDDLNQEERQQLIDETVSMKYPVNWSMLWIVVKRIDADGKDWTGLGYTRNSPGNYSFSQVSTDPQQS